MAQLSLGITVGYAAYAADRTTTPTYTSIPNITEIPSLGASPSAQDATELTQKMKTYVKGLVDVGGSLDFSCNFTKEVVDAVNTAITAQESAEQEIAVTFPAPLNKRCYFKGEFGQVYPGSVGADAVVTGTVPVIPTGELNWEDVS